MSVIQGSGNVILTYKFMITDKHPIINRPVNTWNCKHPCHPIFNLCLIPVNLDDSPPNHNVQRL